MNFINCHSKRYQKTEEYRKKIEKLLQEMYGEEWSVNLKKKRKQ
jgi:hypothetical protein